MVLIVVNPRSGGGRGPRVAESLAQELKARGLEVAIEPTTPGEDPRLDAAILAAGIAIAVGGDGTLNRVARPMILGETSGPVIGFFAAGTANVATRAFALPRDPARFADLVKAGATRPVDAGIATNAKGKRMAFLLWLGAGLDATLIETVAARRAGKSGAGVILDYIRVGIGMALGYQWPEIEVTTPSGSGRFGAAMIANIGPLAVGSITRRADPGDGFFDLIATRPRGRLAWQWAAMLGGLGMYDRVSDVERTRITEASFASAQRVPIQLDGEPCGTLPVSVRMRPSAIRLLSLVETPA